MRNVFGTQYTSFLKYQIREVVEVGKKIQTIDPSMQIVWENIGDPIAKGWSVPPFLKEILSEEISRLGDSAFGYTHSRGMPQAREWAAKESKRLCPTSTLDAEDVLFTSGLGAAISSLYQMLPDRARILQPAPAYPTHASFESFRHRSEPIFYALDPERGWEPGLADMEAKILANPDVCGILLINPNNPTGAVYSRETLQKIVALAEKYSLMIISDEIYFRMVYNDCVHTHIIELTQGKVPTIVMRGMSKDIPWPGSRCGWLEFHGVDLDADYRAYVNAVKQRILLEVCSTTLSQIVLSRVYEHSEFPAWLAVNNKELEKNSREISDMLSQAPGLSVNPTNGAFYMMPLFEKGILNGNQTLPIANDAVREYIENEVKKPGMTVDKRFTYYLLGATGICVVPASGFFSAHEGFRLTTLERNEEKRKDTYQRVVEAIGQYIQ